MPTSWKRVPPLHRQLMLITTVFPDTLLITFNWVKGEAKFIQAHLVVSPFLNSIPPTLCEKRFMKVAVSVLKKGKGE